MTDPIADFLTRIRNAYRARLRYVDAPNAKLKQAIAEILLDQGYIQNYLVIDDGKQGILRLYLKYTYAGQPAIRRLERVSRPGRRVYRGIRDMPRVANGQGIAILSTSRGIMTDKEARKQNVGGEVICYVY
ncbi:MAG: 30S ribosomal protein S8 [Bacteroidetes bacterium]|nr:30S ribosomal protein S8 [Rhodothermia bacterium]MCS7154558.1 30S ribosomal protein S8 [Bacteroidota bacterium]MCX7906275.1 30S ribosomal protein S8 [Bacteroidota bacterium]MDW8137351.1 30S ribosomal protein S8 [Bacteroidota bacterium]MDW8285695.1 30S ribosomal protein S8 [Bacteroidota bacterium]